MSITKDFEKKRAMDGFHYFVGDVNDLLAHTRALESITEYARHKPSCDKSQSVHLSIWVDIPCTCGLSKLLEAVK
jgi:hypothetical protein